MKVISAKKYDYMGKYENAFYVFRNRTTDDEYVVVNSARYLHDDGTSTYYDPINSRRALRGYVGKLQNRLV